MSADDAIAEVRARVTAWAEYDQLVKKAASGAVRGIGAEYAVNKAIAAQATAAEALGPRPTTDECAALALQIDALEKAILSSAGDGAQIDAGMVAVSVVTRTPVANFTHWSQHLAAAFLAQGKALADLRAAVLKLDGVTFPHDVTCSHVNCLDPKVCQSGGKGDESICDDVGVRCSCGVVDIVDMVNLARGEVMKKEEG